MRKIFYSNLKILVMGARKLFSGNVKKDILGRRVSLTARMVKDVLTVAEMQFVQTIVWQP